MALPMKSKMFFRKYRVYCNLFRNYRSSCIDNVRVRFAPSPTGMLHLGGLRTALFNYLFAKSNHGKFVLRIEDTDMSRIVPEAVEKLESILMWTGLIPDEGPSQDGPYGPYTQSQRLELYRDSIEQVLKVYSIYGDASSINSLASLPSGHCYHCFCTERRLDLLRKEAARRGEVPRYDNKCRHLTSHEVQEKIAQHLPHVIRFKYEALDSTWTDLVYGIMHQKSVGETLEGDFIVIKTDGYPTYHFANVIDDHYMKISHVLRGEEWSVSTPKHLQMYKAFGWDPPQYVHLPLILNSDGTKLSKRQGDIKVEHFKEKNYDPNALLNYLTTVNKGFMENTDGKTLQELVPIFSLESLNTHSARLQPENLRHLNRSHLRRRLQGEKRQEIVDETSQLIQNHYKDRLFGDHVLDTSYIENILQWALEHRISHLEDLLSNQLEFIWLYPDLDHVRSLLMKEQKCWEMVENTLNKLQHMETFEEAALKEALLCYCKERELKLRIYMKVLRSCLSGQKEGPAVAEMMAILGKVETLKRLESAVNVLR